MDFREDGAEGNCAIPSSPLIRGGVLLFWALPRAEVVRFFQDGEEPCKVRERGRILVVVADEAFDGGFKVFREEVGGEASFDEPIRSPKGMGFSAWLLICPLDELADIVKQGGEKEYLSLLFFRKITQCLTSLIFSSFHSGAIFD